MMLLVVENGSELGGIAFCRKLFLLQIKDNL